MSKTSTGHAHCCKSRKRPKTSTEFFALNYPSNPSGHKEVNNRLHNSENVPVKFKLKIHETIRKRWYFRLKGEPPLLDGSGNGSVRGLIHGYEHKSSGTPDVNPTGLGDRVVCLNAANLKMLLAPPHTKLEAYGFTFAAPVKGGVGASGWMPLSAITFKSKQKKRHELMMAALRSWACCMERYARWGKSLTKKGKTYRFRSVAQLANAIKAMEVDPTIFKRHFREEHSGSLRNRFDHALKRARDAGGSDAELVRWFRGTFGIVSHNPGESNKNGKWSPGVGNKLGDYLPKPSKPDTPGPTWTNLSANVSINSKGKKKGSTTAPIPADIFPEGHIFHRLVFKDKKMAWGYLYSPTPGKIIGRVEWYYGYCDVVDPVLSAEWPGGPPKEKDKRKQRRYGWVPAFAVE